MASPIGPFGQPTAPYAGPGGGMPPGGSPSLSVNLPWGQLAAQGQALGGLGGDPASAAAQLGPMYANSYNAALNLNSSLFSGLQTGYDTLRSGVDQKYADITKGYGDLYGDVLGRIAGTNQTNLTDINSAYNAQAGGATQNAISRGLGNSTVQSSMQRGIEFDRQRALTASQNQFAQLGAGYAASLGSQGLQAQQAGAHLGAGLGQAQLGMLERVQAPYPDAGMYTHLAQMYGAQAERQRNQGQQDRALAMARQGGPAPRGAVASGGGAGGGFFGPRMTDPGSGGSSGAGWGYAGFGMGTYGNFGGQSNYVRPEGFMSGNYFGQEYDQGPTESMFAGGEFTPEDYYSGGYESQPGGYGGLGDYQDFGYADSYA